MRRIGVIALFVVLSGAGSAHGALRADITRTAHGVPHIEARDYAGAGFGLGYAFAEDNICVMADGFLFSNGERSRYLGPDASYVNPATEIEFNNLEADFFHRWLRDERKVEKLLAKRPRLGPSKRARALVRGYAAGYNRYLRQVGRNGIPDPGCRGKRWVKPISTLDVWRRIYSLTLLAGHQFFGPYMSRAEPPTGDEDSAPQLRPLSPNAFPHLGVGSNAIAIGSDASANGNPLLLANPHFPWYGTERFYEFQLRIPGRLNVGGASVFGLPLPVIGHTRGMAWTHTVSTAWRMTPVELRLAPGNPRAYMYDGEERPLEPHRVTVQARGEDGRLESRSDTLWLSHFGPVVDYPDAFLTWSPETAYAIRDANEGNLRLIDNELAMGEAQSIPGLRRALRRWQAIPWVNTLAVDRRGRAFYADASVVPHVTDEQVEKCATSPVARAIYQVAALPVLDGSRSECEWGSDDDAIEPGILGPRRLPELVRRDYVSNHNDSYWLSNPHQPLEGYERIIGPERTARTLRTRLGLKMIEERIAGRDEMVGRGFTRRKLERLTFTNRNYSGELAADAAADMCERHPFIAVEGEPVDVRPACPVLRAWDRRGELTSRGEALWLEFWKRAAAVPGGPWSEPFDPERPLETPHTLNTAHPLVIEALGAAVKNLRERAIALDARWGQVHGVKGRGSWIPLHGCRTEEGCFNWSSTGRMPDERGVYQTDYGSSFVMAVEFTRRGPRADSLLTYSQSANPRSRYYRDQTWMFSRKRWKRMAFTKSEIERARIGRRMRLRAR